jgi:hypothetical protein
MNLGKWDSAILKSVFLSASLVLMYPIYEIGFPLDLDSLAGSGMFTLLFVSTYLVFSIAGWLLFGFPIHWLICRYSSGSYYLYLSAALLFTLAVYWFADVAEATIIYGLSALLQAMLFRYYAYKQQ